MRSIKELKNIRGKPRSRSSALRARHASIASLREAAELSLRGKRVLVRVDFNIPVRQVRGTTRNVSIGHIAEQRGTVADDTRIVAAVPTIRWLVQKGAKVVLMSHFGRPSTIRHPERAKRSEGSRGSEGGILRSPRGSLRMTELSIVARLGELLKKKVGVAEKWDFTQIHTVVKKMKSGEIVMLPNLRLHPGEEKNSPAFARELAGLAQVYVNEAFSVSHRKHASVVGVPRNLPAYAGLQLMREVEALGRVLHHPEKPFIVMMGGGKITDKMAMLKVMVKRADTVLVGGALATHFFRAMRYGVGASRIEAEGVKLARTILGGRTSDPTEVRPRIVLPRDVVVGTLSGKDAKVVEVPGVASESSRRRSLSAATPIVLCSAPYGIWDIGPQTILEYAKHIKQARTLIWNGPMGLYEVKRFSHGTLALGRLFAARSKGKAFGVAGGGETIDALKQTGLIEYVDFVSTGGGAMLEFLGGKKLPGIEVLAKPPS